ncbi:MAG: ABC transporter permease [Trueperaceae bacterium]|nr:ABC transporter permease [Trueperaceae bacterium]
MKPIWTAFIAALVALLGIGLGPLAQEGSSTLLGFFPVLLALLCLGLALIGKLIPATLAVPVALIGAYLPIGKLSALGNGSVAAWGYWANFWGFLLVAFFAAGRVSLSEADGNEERAKKRLRGALPPATVPFILLLIWQGLVIGFQVPKGIFPGVHHVYNQLASSLGVLLTDSYITFVKEVQFGFLIGVSAGFLVGIAIAYSRFLQNGFLPIAAAFGAVPIVGLAPVLGRAFGVDWQSKAAVVVIVTFFPVVLNTVQGLTQLDTLKLELLKAYAANPWQIFLKLRLPNALPFLFNALKLAAVLSVISVIVAEFLIPGPPRGLGQRISLSARQGAYDTVFAAIFVSSLISITIYQLLSWLERSLTGWHPSYREEGH